MALTTVDLYRAGSSTNARLDNLRNADVDIYTIGTENQICLRAATTKGLSTWDSVARLVNLNLSGTPPADVADTAPDDPFAPERLAA